MTNFENGFGKIATIIAENKLRDIFLSRAYGHGQTQVKRT